MGASWSWRASNSTFRRSKVDVSTLLRLKVEFDYFGLEVTEEKEVAVVAGVPAKKPWVKWSVSV